MRLAKRNDEVLIWFRRDYRFITKSARALDIKK